MVVYGLFQNNNTFNLALFHKVEYPSLMDNLMSTLGTTRSLGNRIGTHTPLNLNNSWDLITMTYRECRERTPSHRVNYYSSITPTLCLLVKYSTSSIVLVQQVEEKTNGV